MNCRDPVRCIVCGCKHNNLIHNEQAGNDTAGALHTDAGMQDDNSSIDRN